MSELEPDTGQDRETGADLASALDAISTRPEHSVHVEYADDDTVQTPPLSFRPGDSVAANIIADALTRATGWLPLSVRYRAAQVALETAHQWHEVKPTPTTEAPPMHRDCVDDWNRGDGIVNPAPGKCAVCYRDL